MPQDMSSISKFRAIIKMILAFYDIIIWPSMIWEILMGKMGRHHEEQSSQFKKSNFYSSGLVVISLVIKTRFYSLLPSHLHCYVSFYFLPALRLIFRLQKTRLPSPPSPNKNKTQKEKKGYRTINMQLKARIKLPTYQ